MNTTLLSPAAEAFLAATGYGGAHRAALPQDAGHRRYTRLSGAVPRPALLMDCAGAGRVGWDGRARRASRHRSPQRVSVGSHPPLRDARRARSTTRRTTPA